MHFVEAPFRAQPERARSEATSAPTRSAHATAKFGGPVSITPFDYDPDGTRATDKEAK